MFCFRSLRRKLDQASLNNLCDAEMRDLTFTNQGIQTAPVTCTDPFEFTCEFDGPNCATQANIQAKMCVATATNSDIVKTKSKSVMTESSVELRFGRILEDDERFQTVIGVQKSFFRLLLLLLQVCK